MTKGQIWVLAKGLKKRNIFSDTVEEEMQELSECLEREDVERDEFQGVTNLPVLMFAESMFVKSCI